MGNATVLFGYIDAPNEGAEMNATSIAALSESDSWPYLTSDLFSVPHVEHSYNDHLITFGTVFKNLDLDTGWLKWRAKFEALLRTMSWTVVHVYLDIEQVGHYHFIWQQDMWRPSDWNLPQDIKRSASALREVTGKPVERWTFSGGPLEDTSC
jgi:hypothetical protein